MENAQDAHRLVSAVLERMLELPKDKNCLRVIDEKGKELGTIARELFETERAHVFSTPLETKREASNGSRRA